MRKMVYAEPVFREFIMLKHCLVFVLLAAVLLLPPCSVAAQERDGIIGTIVDIEGGATVTPEGGKPAKAGDEQPVYLNDTIEVAKGGRALLLLIDNTRWTLASGAKFRVDEYTFDPTDNTDNHATYSVLQGAFQYVSGLVAKKPEPEVSIAVPVGSIGIRGTDITASPDEAGGYDIFVDEGAIDMKTDAGTARMKQGEGGFIKDRKARPGALRKDRLQGMRGTVALKNREEVMARIAQMKSRQQALQMKFRDYMQNNPAMRQKLQQRRELRQQKMQEFKTRQQEQRQQKAEQLRGQMQERQQQQQERREELRENMQERRELRQQKWRRN